MSAHGIMANKLDCSIVVSKLECHSRYYIHFWINTPSKGMNPFMLTDMGWIVLLLFYKDSFGID